MSGAVSTIRRAARSGLFGVVLAQAPSSLSNFIPALLLSLTLPAAVFGRFAVVMAAVYMALDVTRIGVVQPFLVARADQRGQGQLPLADLAPFLLLTALVGPGVALVFGLGVYGVLACWLVTLMCVAEEALRQSFFAAYRPLAAAAMDAVWLVLAVAAVLALPDDAGYVAASLAWGTPAVIAAGIGWLWSRHIRTTEDRQRWKVRDLVGLRSLSVGFLIAYGVGQLAGQLPFLVLARNGYWSSVGELRQVLLVFGPVSSVYSALSNFMLPRARAYRENLRGERTTDLRRVSALLGLIAAAWLAMIVAAWPILGVHINSSLSVVLVVGLSIVLGAGVTPGTLLIQALGRPRALVAVRLAGLAFPVVAILPVMVVVGATALGGSVLLLLSTLGFLVGIALVNAREAPATTERSGSPRGIAARSSRR